MDLLPYEQEIDKLKREQVVLTTHRLRLTRTSHGSVSVTSIMLENLCSAECKYHSNIAWLIAGVFFLIASVIAGIQVDAVGFYGIALAVFCLLAYILTRGGYMAFRSAGARIETIKTNIGIDRMLSFIDKVEAAQNRRYFINADNSVMEKVSRY